MNTPSSQGVDDTHTTSGNSHSVETVTLRRAHPKDAARLAELEVLLFPEDSPWSVDAFVADMSSVNYFYVCAEANGQVVGYAGLGLRGTVDDPEFEVTTIGVDPRWQGCGVGSALFDALLEAADSYRGPVFLEVRCDNEPAIRLYERRGFTKLGVRRGYYQPSGADAWTMLRPAVVG